MLLSGDFAKNLAASKSPAAIARDRAFLARHYGVPLANVIAAPLEWDVQGVDYAVLLPDGRIISVDAQGRQMPSRKYWARPDRPELALELIGDVARNLPGKFARRQPPLAHYLMQTWLPSEFSGAVLVSTSAAWSGIAQGRFSDLEPITTKNRWLDGEPIASKVLMVDAVRLSASVGNVWCIPGDE